MASPTLFDSTRRPTGDWGQHNTPQNLSFANYTGALFDEVVRVQTELERRNDQLEEFKGKLITQRSELVTKRTELQHNFENQLGNSQSIGSEILAVRHQIEDLSKRIENLDHQIQKNIEAAPKAEAAREQSQATFFQLKAAINHKVELTAENVKAPEHTPQPRTAPILTR